METILAGSRWRRSSLRLAHYDYANFGAVFITICTHDRQHLFGTVVNGEVILSAPGVSAEHAWLALPTRFPHLELDAFVIMPDHLHGILITTQEQSPNERRIVLGDVVNAFKNMMLAAWRKGVRDNGWPRYEQQLWQRAFHDKLLRNEQDVEAMRGYIESNPIRWEQKRRGYD